jgi:hypothetical protein
VIRSLQNFVGQIGWRQGLCPVTLSAANLASSSGQRFESYSALVNAATLYDVWPEYDSQLASAVLETNFNDWLALLQSSAIDQVMHSIFAQNMDMLENEMLYKHEMDFSTVIANGADFVGFKIDVTRDRRFVTIINSVQATFDAAGTVTLYLFNTSKLNPVQQIDITTVANDTVEVDLNWALDPAYAGNFYIGYLTNGLVPQAYDRNFELANLPTGLKYSYFDEIRIPGHTASTLPDSSLEVSESKSWGLNFNVSAFTDWTQIALSNKAEFLQCIGMQVAVNALDAMINSPRSNRNERISRADARLALEGNTNPELGLFTQGLRTRLQEEVKNKRNLFVRKSMISRGTLH